MAKGRRVEFSLDDLRDKNRAAIGIPVLVRDVMTVSPITVEPTATVKDIAQVLLERDIRCVPVVDVGDQLIGIVSEADLISREGYPTVRSHHLAGLVNSAVVDHRHHWTARAEGLIASEIMTEEVITCAPDEPVTVVSRRMLRHDVRTLPVMEENRLIGILSRHDLLRLFDRPDTEIRQSLANLLADPLWVPPGHAVQAEVRDGVVILTGTVRQPQEVAIVGRAVRQVPGVIEVVNRVSGPGPKPKSATTDDPPTR
jgi:CBS domain-containing protein